MAGRYEREKKNKKIYSEMSIIGRKIILHLQKFQIEIEIEIEIEIIMY